MKIIADTNLLVRAAVRDDAVQSRSAARILKGASTIAVTLPSLCEFVWVLRRVYRISRTDVASSVRALLAARNVETNRPAVEAGLAILESGGNFADGVIAYEGAWLGGEIFVTFDKQAAAALKAQGVATRLLA